jgi:lactoylglutathione lyase
MKFDSIMHASYYTDKFDEMIDFYCNKLGLKQKVIVRFKEYKGRKDRPQMAAIAEKDPERIFYTYIEIAPGQFIELFPSVPGQKPHPKWNEYCGYGHIALMTDDIFRTQKELIAAGIQPDTAPSKGPSNTWQMWVHDPDDNYFEIMQYTPESWQVTGHIS